MDSLRLLYCINCKLYKKGLEHSTPPPPKLGKEAYNCIKKFNIPAILRSKIYPFNISTSVIIATTKETYNVHTLSEDSVAFNYIKDTISLNKKNKNGLTNLLFNYSVKGNEWGYSINSHYFPQGYILFYNNDKLLEFISFNFEYHEFRTSNYDIDWGEFCTEKYSMLKKFFLSKGIKVLKPLVNNCIEEGPVPPKEIIDKKQ